MARAKRLFKYFLESASRESVIMHVSGFDDLFDFFEIDLLTLIELDELGFDMISIGILPIDLGTWLKFEK